MDTNSRCLKEQVWIQICWCWVKPIFKATVTFLLVREIKAKAKSHRGFYLEGSDFYNALQNTIKNLSSSNSPHSGEWWMHFYSNVNYSLIDRASVSHLCSAMAFHGPHVLLPLSMMLFFIAELFPFQVLPHVLFGQISFVQQQLKKMK